MRRRSGLADCVIRRPACLFLLLMLYSQSDEVLSSGLHPSNMMSAVFLSVHGARFFSLSYHLPDGGVSGSFRLFLSIALYLWVSGEAWSLFGVSCQRRVPFRFTALFFSFVVSLTVRRRERVWAVCSCRSSPRLVLSLVRY